MSRQPLNHICLLLWVGLSREIFVCELLRGGVKECTAVFERVIKRHIICSAADGGGDFELSIFLLRYVNLTCENSDAAAGLRSHFCDSGDDLSTE